MNSQFRQLVAWLIVSSCLLLTACTSASTVITHSWRDPVRPTVAIGRTLVLAIPFSPLSEVGVRAENAWVTHLRQRGIDAQAWSQLAPDLPVPEKRDVVATVRGMGFDTLLVARVVDLKKVERDTAASQVAVVETLLYDGNSEQIVWWAESDTYLISHTGEEIRYPRDSVLREYVEVVSREISAAGLL
ncbi:hypothetical protein SAMN04487965_3383 [Microbulbifer donghaiensis]|uniref:DUF4136 domain-containing protein n=1 Tax=Microbulbifer donghaiensis TaxID=494016 RepID=A0A1M5HD24_9GAMM|nr:hypothetical protein [Microbulbifer donghaiensis]SHG13712.1 hypothetical protein SAMN04487965_3383 [Microbulbifer donghaiensis]